MLTGTTWRRPTNKRPQPVLAHHVHGRCVDERSVRREGDEKRSSSLEKNAFPFTLDSCMKLRSLSPLPLASFYKTFEETLLVLDCGNTE